MIDPLLFRALPESCQAIDPFVRDRLWELYEFRVKLLEQGYLPLPIFARHKMPYIHGWTSAPITKEWLFATTFLYRNHTNTGLRTDDHRGIDIDLHDPAHVFLIHDVINQTAGVTMLQRVGSKGVCLLYNNKGQPERKVVIHTPRTKHQSSQTLVEILGTGNQFCAYGWHDGAKKRYEWIRKGYEPLLVPSRDLPVIPHARLVEEVIPELIKELRRQGYVAECRHVSDYGDGDRSAPPPIGVALSDAGAAAVTNLFLVKIISKEHTTRSSGYYDLQTCPSCQHDDYKAGLAILDNGGFRFRCFHSACEYNEGVRWQPGWRIGPRAKALYRALGGDPLDFLPVDQMERYALHAKETNDLILQIKRGVRGV